MDNVMSEDTVPSPGLSSLGQIAVTVEDVERATRFYRDVLGLPFLFDAPPGLAFFDLDGIRLMLTVPEGTEAGSSVLYFRVADLELSYDRLRDRGVTFVGEPHVVHKTDNYELSMAAFKDSEGNLMALMRESGQM
jgi:methylmalonyl-CoA/ethylmalonyl-CoA epimerase